MNVYERLKLTPFVVNPPRLVVNCFVSEWRFEFISLTTPNLGSIREPTSATAPVDGTMKFAGAYTGRPASVANVNFGVVFRLRSIALVCATPRAYERSTEKL